MSDLKLGSRWRSAVCDTEVAVIRVPRTALILQCGGHPMLIVNAERPVGVQLAPDHAHGALLGKRYEDAGSGIEVLCTKAGAGSLTVDGVPLTIKAAKRLPSSD
jgi:hypothetical protein